jgi:hypothetical protein
MRTALLKKKGNSGASAARLSISVGRDSVEPGKADCFGDEFFRSAPNFFSPPRAFPRKLAAEAADVAKWQTQRT